MKIAFVLGGLEPGANGVGDYCRNLATEIVRENPEYQCLLIAINDPKIQEISRDATGLPANCQVLRLPGVMAEPQRIAAAYQAVDQFAPDWLSIQFVIYSYQKKGLPLGLANKLKPLAKGRKVHLMFHELWIGTLPEEPWKYKPIGWLQRGLIKKMVKALRPALIHTSNQHYQDRLKGINVQAGLLPLFGNMPVTTQSADSWLLPKIAEVQDGPVSREDLWVIGFFGAILPLWPREPLLTRIGEGSTKAGKKVTFVSIGRIGAAGGRLWQDMVDQYQSPQFKFLQLGEQPAERISEFMNSIDFGVSYTTWSIVGKSGAAASMLEHGVPVIVNRDDGYEYEADPLLIKISDDLGNRMAAGIPRRPQRAMLPVVTRSLVEQLQSK